MVLKRSKLHQFLMVWHELLTTQAWVSEGWQEFENFSKKVVFSVSSDKKQISPLLVHPHRKTFGKIY